MSLLRLAPALALVVLMTGAAAQQVVEVPSPDRSGSQALMLRGFWFAPPAGAPAPALVLLHGCGGPYGAGGGLSERLRGMPARLQAMGVGALVLDSLSARGERELCTQRMGTRAVTQLHRRRDALGALQWLAQQPGVDAARLGLIGWSHGGSTVLASTNRRHAEVAGAVLLPSLAVAYYPGCAADLARGYEAAAPLLMLVGEADDWTPAAPCKALAAAATGAPVQIEAYAGAHHGFDSLVPLRLRTDVPNGAQPGRGVHVGGDPAAREASLARLDAFLRERWGLAAP